MPKTASINIRVEPHLKSSAEALFSCYGMSVAEAVNIFLHKSLLENGLPFDLREPRYNAETEAAIQEARDIMSGKIQAKSYDSFQEMLNEAIADDSEDSVC
jgi:DNA-damage-inducible protein J